MSEYRVIITPIAGSEIEEIHRYISKDSAANAAAMVTRILDALEPLKQFPHRAKIDRQSPGLRHPVRSLVVKPYIIYFRVLDDDRVVRVLSVRHGARRPPKRFD